MNTVFIPLKTLYKGSSPVVDGVDSVCAVVAEVIVVVSPSENGRSFSSADNEVTRYSLCFVPDRINSYFLAAAG